MQMCFILFDFSRFFPTTHLFIFKLHLFCLLFVIIPGDKYMHLNVKMNKQTELFWKWMDLVNNYLYRFNMLPWEF